MENLKIKGLRNKEAVTDHAGGCQSHGWVRQALIGGLGVGCRTGQGHPFYSPQEAGFSIDW